MALNPAALRTHDLTHSRGPLAKEQLLTLVPLGTDYYPGCLHTLGQTPRPLPRPAALAAERGPAPPDGALRPGTRPLSDSRLSQPEKAGCQGLPSEHPP